MRSSRGRCCAYIFQTSVSSIAVTGIYSLAAFHSISEDASAFLGK